MQSTPLIAVRDMEAASRNASHREIWPRDPDGSIVVLASAAGDL